MTFETTEEDERVQRINTLVWVKLRSPLTEVGWKRTFLSPTDQDWGGEERVGWTMAEYRPDEKEKVREELESMLADSHFSIVPAAALAAAVLTSLRVSNGTGYLKI